MDYEYYNRRWNEADEFTYTLSGNKLTINFKYEQQSAKIVALDNNKLSLYYTLKEGSDYQEWTDTFSRVK